jgi:hypothetical protein
MTATLALLAAALAAPPGPLPNGKSFDALTYSFGNGVLGPTGSLSIAADGKASYFYSSAPHTGSGGRVVKKEWTLTKEEKAELFRKLVEAGLLDLPEGHGVPFSPGIAVSSGKWRTTLGGHIPDKVMAQLRPVLAKADPGMWAEEPAAKPAKSEPVKLKSVSYTFTPKADGESASLYLQPGGVVLYRRQAARNAPAGPFFVVEKEWKLPAKEMEALFDALTTDGLFDLDDTGGGKFPSHQVEAQAGRWQTRFHPKELPEKVRKHLLPLLQKADAEFWK